MFEESGNLHQTASDNESIFNFQTKVRRYSKCFSGPNHPYLAHLGMLSVRLPNSDSYHEDRPSLRWEKS